MIRSIAPPLTDWGARARAHSVQQCMQYTEVQVRPAGGGGDVPLTFRKLCETPSVEDVYEDRFVSVTYTKKYAASEVFLRAPLPDDAVLGGLVLNVSRASSFSSSSSSSLPRRFLLCPSHPSSPDAPSTPSDSICLHV